MSNFDPVVLQRHVEETNAKREHTLVERVSRVVDRNMLDRWHENATKLITRANQVRALRGLAPHGTPGRES